MTTVRIINLIASIITNLEILLIELEDRVKRWSKNMLRSAAIASGILLGTVLNTNISDAQYILHGTLRNLDRNTGISLQSARVDIDSSSYVSKTDANGNFSISIPSGIHNIRFSMPGYIGLFKQNVNVTSDTIFNASMPDTVQQSPNGTQILTLDNYMGPNYHGLFRVSQSYPNAFVWRNVTEGNLIPVYLNNADAYDSTNFFGSLGACDGDWTHAASGSVENKQKRALYILSNDPQTGVTKKGVSVNFHAGSTNTIPLAYESDNTYVYIVQVNLASSDGASITKEMFGRVNILNDVDAAYRISMMNANGPTPNDLDHMLMSVYFNWWAAIARGEQNVNMYDMENTPIFTTPASSIITQPSNNSTNVPLDQLISWSNSFGTNTYELQLAKDSAFTSIVADSSLGRINTKLNLDLNTNYFIRVRAKNDVGTSGWSTPVRFTTIPPIPSQPSIVQPINNSTNQPTSVVAKWGPVPFAVNYHLQFGKDSTFATTDLDTLTADTLKALNNLQNSQKYFMRVNANNVAGSSGWANSNFTTIPNLPGVPIIIQPVNSSTNQPINLVMKWSKINGATGYHAQLSIDSLFASTKIDTVLADTALQFSNLLNSKKYFARINSQNIAGNSSWANSSFTTIVALPGMPVLIAPANYSVNQPINLTLSWSKSSSADSTEVQFGNDSTFVSISKDTTVNNALLNVNGLQNSQKYSWRAKSKNVAGASNWTNGWSFTTIHPPVLPYVAQALKDTTVHKNIASVLLSPDVRNNIKGDNIKSYSTNASFGTAIISNDSLIFKPNYGFTGPVLVTLSGKDSLNNTASTISTVQVNNTPPTAVTLTPLSIDTVKYDNITITSLSSKSRDIDGDTLTYLVRFYGNGLDTTISTRDTSAALFSKVLKPSSVYNISWKVTDGTDTTSSTNILTFYTAKNLTGVLDNNPNIPQKFELYQNYPNPFNPTTTFKYDLPKSARVRVDLFDLLGTNVKILVDEVQSAGTYTIKFNASNLSTGVYFYRLKTNDFSQTKKLLLMR